MLFLFTANLLVQSVIGQNNSGSLLPGKGKTAPLPLCGIARFSEPFLQQPVGGTCSGGKATVIA